MYYLGIDQHRKQLTVNLRDEGGTSVLRRQVSTEWERVRSFLEEVRGMAAAEAGFLAMVEVCGFNDWLLKLHEEYGCGDIVLVQPTGRSKRKTDRRDASLLSEQQWLNRHRLLVQWRTKTINKVHRILLKHN